MDNDDYDYYTPPPLYGYIDKKVLKNNKPNMINIKMIMDRNLKKTIKLENSNLKMGQIKEDKDNSTDEDEKAQNYEDVAEIKATQLLKLTHVYLDRENIGEIDNLAEYLGDVTHLYLQNNLIKQIENLEFINKLKFLCLSHNQIKTIENLHMLNNLKLLDLSYNLIENINDMKELPKNLVALDLSENPYAENLSYMSLEVEKLKNSLKNLNQLNGQFFREVSKKVCNDNLKTPKPDEDSFEKMRLSIVERSKIRQKCDKEFMENISKDRKKQLDEARRSIDQNFNK